MGGRLLAVSSCVITATILTHSNVHRVLISQGQSFSCAHCRIFKCPCKAASPQVVSSHDNHFHELISVHLALHVSQQRNRFSHSKDNRFYGAISESSGPYVFPSEFEIIILAHGILPGTIGSANFILHIPEVSNFEPRYGSNHRSPSLRSLHLGWSFHDQLRIRT
jgi:hypothetical protein